MPNSALRHRREIVRALFHQLWLALNKQETIETDSLWHPIISFSVFGRSFGYRTFTFKNSLLFTQSIGFQSSCQHSPINFPEHTQRKQPTGNIPLCLRFGTDELVLVLVHDQSFLMYLEHLHPNQKIFFHQVFKNFRMYLATNLNSGKVYGARSIGGEKYQGGYRVYWWWAMQIFQISLSVWSKPSSV